MRASPTSRSARNPARGPDRSLPSRADAGIQAACAPAGNSAKQEVRSSRGDQMASGEQRFAGRGAVITGGASGIGWTVAKRLAAEGAKVCIWDRADAPAGETIEAIHLDITDAAAVDVAAKRTAELFGGIDILVCSAAITGPN